MAATDERGCVLLVWQTTGPYRGHWLLPGGAIERNETVLEGARRELAEETGYELVEPRLVCAYDVTSEPRGAFHIVLFMLRASVRGTARAEHGSEVRWSDLTDVPLHPALRRELLDAGIRPDDEMAVARDLAALGARIERIR